VFERFGRANDAVQFLGTLLRGGGPSARLLAPFTLDPVKMALAVQKPDSQSRDSSGAARRRGQCQHKILSFRGSRCRCRLLEDFFVEKIYGRGMTLLRSQVFESCPAGDVERGQNSCWRFLRFAAGNATSQFFGGDPKYSQASRAHHSGSAESFLRAIIRPKRKADWMEVSCCPSKKPMECALRCKGVRECSGKYRPFRDRLAGS